MKIIKQICIILLFYVLGEMLAFLISAIIPSIFIPGTVLGLVLLVISLNFRIVKMEHVETVGTFLTSNMAFFFVPVAVSVISYLDLFQHVIVKIIVICVISIIVSFLAVVYSIKLTLWIQNKIRRGEENV